MSLLGQTAGFQQQARQEQRQHLSLQARQQLRLLKLPLFELSTELRQQAELNPFLEFLPPRMEIASGSLYESNEKDLKESTNRDYLLNGYEGYGDQKDWSAQADEASRRDFFLTNQVAPITLYRHLETQVLRAYEPGPKRDLILFVCDQLDKEGYLRNDDALKTPKTPRAILLDWWEFHHGQPPLSEEKDIIEAIKAVQRLDPVGVGARSIAESFELQIRADERTTSARTLRIQLCQNLSLLNKGAAGVHELCKRLHCTHDELLEAIAYLKTLNRAPGNAFLEERPPEEPEIFAIQSTNGAWIASCNEALLPIFRVNNQAITAVKPLLSKPEETQWIKEKEAEARLWAESYAERNETLRRVAQQVFNRQTDFLNSAGNPAFLKPLLQKEIAEVLDFDESTISRAVTEKVVCLLPSRKKLPLKEFFTRALPTTDVSASGEAFSDQQAKHALRELIEAEDRTHPLSDQALMELLNQQGFSLKRRTVAKYRESLGILSTRERRQTI